MAELTFLGTATPFSAFLFSYQLLSGATNRSGRPWRADRTQQLETQGSPRQTQPAPSYLGPREHVSQCRFYWSSLAGSSSSVLRKIPEMDRAPGEGSCLLTLCDARACPELADAHGDGSHRAPAVPLPPLTHMPSSHGVPKSL